MKTQASALPVFPSLRPKSTVLKTALNGFEFAEVATTDEEPLRPPEFHTGEELNATPPILKSLSPCHGPQTFICVPATTQACTTFVIPPGTQDDDDATMNNAPQEFLSYVIEPKKDEPTEADQLRTELDKITLELKERDQQVDKLTRIRRDGERELEDLTASLFQEAHRMVREANEKAAAAEKSLNESQMKVDVLMAEVTALKTLVLTSTPSRPNPHLHPQIANDPASGGNLFRKHRRSPSHFNLKYGRENSPPESPVQSDVTVAESLSLCTEIPSEVDPILHKEIMSWRENPKMDKMDPFIARVYLEDIDLCLSFNNRELAAEVRLAVENHDIFIEAVSDKTKTVFPRKCALLEVARQCHYRMKLGKQETWHSISQICRNRIIAVCDFFNYLRYIELGLVKSTAHDIYWEIIRLRKEMVLARLGLSLSSK